MSEDLKENFVPFSHEHIDLKNDLIGYARELKNKEGLENCLPGMPSLEHGLSVYFKYFNKQEEKEFGVIAVHL
jgi:ASC-1-like (ASCH) protein